MHRIDSKRRDTPLERIIKETLMEFAREEGVDAFDQERINAAIGEALESLATATAATLNRTMGTALAEQAAMRRGFEERLRARWSPALERLGALIIACVEAGEGFVRERRAEGDWDFVDEALTRIHARSCLVAQEVLALIQAGFASGAHARWRSLHELAVIAFFIRERGEQVAAGYLLHSTVTTWRALPAAVEYARRLGSAAPTAAEQEHLRALVSDLEKRFGRPYLGEWGWAAAALGLRRVRFIDIEAGVDLDHLRPYFHMANYAVHAGSKALYVDLGAEASRGLSHLAGASNTGLGEPGQGAAVSLAQVTTALLMSRQTVERILMMRALQIFTAETLEAFAERHNAMEAVVDLRFGAKARRRVFLSRRARPLSPSRLMFLKARRRRRVIRLAATPRT